MSKNSEDQHEGKEPLGISTFLPPMGAARLARAAETARRLPEGSVERSKTVDAAIADVRSQWPNLFREKKTPSEGRLFE